MELICFRKETLSKKQKFQKFQGPKVPKVPESSFFLVVIFLPDFPQNFFLGFPSGGSQKAFFGVDVFLPKKVFQVKGFYFLVLMFFTLSKWRFLKNVFFWWLCFPKRFYQVEVPQLFFVVVVLKKT